MTDTAILRGVLDKTGAIVGAVTPDQYDLPTPCPDYTVGDLVQHVVTWIRVFARAAAGAPQPADAGDEGSADPAADFRAAADQAVEAFSTLPDDEPVTLSSGSTPAAASVAMMTGEYLAHGWDLAVATGQPAPYTEQEAEAARAGLTPLLAPEYRGAGKPFGDIVDVPDDASGLDKFLGFAGRRPH